MTKSTIFNSSLEDACQKVVKWLKSPAGRKQASLTFQKTEKMLKAYHETSKPKNHASLNRF